MIDAVITRTWLVRSIKGLQPTTYPASWAAAGIKSRGSIGLPSV